ncbi:GNAT family N-acetyltransferase [Leifsonia sp. SIMBA_070]
MRERARGHGLGRQLPDKMILACDNAGVWTIQSSIFRENAASL